MSKRFHANVFKNKTRPSFPWHNFILPDTECPTRHWPPPPPQAQWHRWAGWGDPQGEARTGRWMWRYRYWDHPWRPRRALTPPSDLMRTAEWQTCLSSTEIEDVGSLADEQTQHLHKQSFTHNITPSVSSMNRSESFWNVRESESSRIKPLSKFLWSDFLSGLTKSRLYIGNAALTLELKKILT